MTNGEATILDAIRIKAIEKVDLGWLRDFLTKYRMASTDQELKMLTNSLEVKFEEIFAQGHINASAEEIMAEATKIAADGPEWSVQAVEQYAYSIVKI